MNMTYREILSCVVSKFRDRCPDLVLLTTFNLSTDFFERNVLPILVGYELDELAKTPPLIAQLNERLKETRVLVVHDQSTQPDSKGNLRYGLLPVGLRNGFFHSKLILLTGILEDGSHGAWLLVTSANLTYSGWGRNREAIGTTRVGAGQARELDRLLDWMLRITETYEIDAGNDSEDGARKTLGVLKQRLQDLNPVEDEATYPELLIQLPGDAGLLARLFHGNAVTKTLRVVSPYWSEVGEILEKAGAERAILIPSVVRDGKYRFPEDEIPDDLKPRIGFAKFSNEQERYTHAKCQEWGEKGHFSICIGSSNFTSAALGLGCERRNIEAVLLYRRDESLLEPHIETLKDPEFSTDGSENEDTPPAKLPFIVRAWYDWKVGQFHCRLYAFEGNVWSESEHKGYKVVYADKMSGFGADNTATIYDIRLSTPHRSCTLMSRDREFSIHVDQYHARDDQLGYLPRPSLNSILDRLSMMDVEELQKGHSGMLTWPVFGGEDDEAESDGCTRNEFDLFTAFRGLYRLRKLYLDADGSGDPYDDHSYLWQLLTALEIEREQPRGKEAPSVIRRYLLLCELESIIESFKCRHMKSKDFNTRLVSLLNADEYEIRRLLQQSESLSTFLGSQELPVSENIIDCYLRWFRQEMISMADKWGRQQ